MRQLFRQSALDTLSNQDSDIPLRIPPSKPSLLILACLAALGAVIAWSFTGVIRDMVEVPGLLVQNPAFSRSVVLAPSAGEVSEILVQVDETVQVGQVVARLLLSDDSGIIDVESAYSGTVTRLNVRRGERIEANTTLVALRGVLDETTPQAPLEAVLYVRYADVQRVRSGMTVYIALEGVSTLHHGYLTGSVISIAEFPSTDSFARAVSPNAAVVSVRVTLHMQPDGRYDWTLPSDETVQMRSGLQVIGRISVSDERPIDRVLSLANDAR
jgi:hypothetical protein